MSHLAIEGLVPHSELDEWTGITGHLFTGLQQKKKIYNQEIAMASEELAKLRYTFITESKTCGESFDHFNTQSIVNLPLVTKIIQLNRM